MPYHPMMAPPPFVVAVVGSSEPLPAEVQTAAWVAGRDIAWAGAWLAVDVGGSVATAVARGAREHDGVVLGFCSHEYRHVSYDEADVSLVIRSGLNRPTHATTVAANADALLAFPGDPDSMAVVAAALQRSIPAAQVATDLWPVRPLTPVEVPAWLDELISRAVPAAPPADPPDPPVLTHIPHRHTPASGSATPANTTSSSSTAGNAESSPSHTTPRNASPSMTGTATE